jgi:hypothetical protein
MRAEAIGPRPARPTRDRSSELAPSMSTRAAGDGRSSGRNPHNTDPTYPADDRATAHRPSSLDLMIHVGLPKTATTFAQVHLFRGTPGYLGLDHEARRPGDRALLNELRDLATMHHVLADDEVRSRTRAWVAKVHDVSVALYGLTRISISHEGLSRWPIDGRYNLRWPIREYPADWLASRRRHGPHPLASFLEHHLVPEWRRLGTIRVSISLRNQADWLASLYAQLSNRIASASQRDFAHQVRMLIAHDDPSIDFFALAQDLGHAVGPDNLRVLLFEDAARPEHWIALAQSMGLEGVEELGARFADLPRLNVKSTGADATWHLRPSRASMPRVWIDHTLDRVWPRDSLPRTRRIVRRGIVRVGRRTFGAAGWRLIADRGRGDVLRMTPALREEIRGHCAKSNQALAELVGRDLAALGY